MLRGGYGRQGPSVVILETHCPRNKPISSHSINCKPRGIPNTCTGPGTNMHHLTLTRKTPQQRGHEIKDRNGKIPPQRSKLVEEEQAEQEAAACGCEGGRNGERLEKRIKAFEL